MIPGWADGGKGFRQLCGKRTLNYSICFACRGVGGLIRSDEDDDDDNGNIVVFGEKKKVLLTTMLIMFWFSGF